MWRVLCRQFSYTGDVGAKEHLTMMQLLTTLASQVDTSSTADPTPIIQALIDAAGNGQWLAVVGFGLALVAYAMNAFVLSRVSTALRLSLTAVVVFIGGLSGVFLTAGDGVTAGSIIMQAIALAGTSGLLGLILSKVAKPKAKADPEPEPESDPDKPNVKPPAHFNE